MTVLSRIGIGFWNPSTQKAHMKGGICTTGALSTLQMPTDVYTCQPRSKVGRGLEQELPKSCASAREHRLLWAIIFTPRVRRPCWSLLCRVGYPLCEMFS